MSDREAVTLCPCPACGGEFRKLEYVGNKYRTVLCKWCTRGACDAEQIKTWKNRKKP